MHDTVSIRTATRWSSSDGGSAARATSGRTLSIALVAAAMLALPGCRSTSTYYLPTEGQPRLNQDEFRDASDQILSVECPRLMGTSDYATGEARARIYLDRSGAVQKMEFTRPSKDERMNTVWGGARRAAPVRSAGGADGRSSGVDDHDRLFLWEGHRTDHPQDLEGKRARAARVLH